MFSFSKRGESMRIDPKKHKRTPSFTTRRRTQSFRRHTKNLNTVENLPPVEVDGYLDRKQGLQAGGKRATIRSWKNYYTVLCGQLMCFFRDQEDFFQSKAASSPIMIYQAGIEAANDYTKKAFVFRVHVTDGSEYLFSAESQEQQEEWVKKLKFHASLTPAKQLTSYKSLSEATEEQSEPVYANLPTSGANTQTQPTQTSMPPPTTTGNVGPSPPKQLPRTLSSSSANSTNSDAGYGVAGTRDLLNQKPGSREPIAVTDNRMSMPDPPLYANVDQLRVDRSNTLPVAPANRRSVGQSETDGDSVSVSSTSKEKKGSVLGRFLNRKKT